MTSSWRLAPSCLQTRLVQECPIEPLSKNARAKFSQGVCCIDEFDKMTSQHNALLEAMEQQAVSIAKAGVVNTLPARAAVLAAANPIGGHYNRAKTVAENLKINPALLSRSKYPYYK